MINLVTNEQSEDKQIGLIEIGEIYFKKSNKGNHKEKLDRRGRKHGYSSFWEDPAVFK